MSIKTIIVTILFAIISCAALANDAGDVMKRFDAAQQAYRSGRYDVAVQSYESILASGFRSGDLYYDLGCAYLKEGSVGRAILSFERARCLMPRDTDLFSNLQYANSLIKQKVQPRPSLHSFRLIDKGLSYLTLDETIILAFCMFYAIMVITIIGLFVRRIRPVLIFTFVLLMGVLISILPSAYGKFVACERSAVVVSPIVDAHYEPIIRSPIHFPLYEGMSVSILRIRGEWCKIERVDGKIGWVPIKDISPISHT